MFAEPDDTFDAWNCKDRETVERIKSAEDVGRKERKLYFFDPVRPAIGPAVQRKKLFVSFAPEIPRHYFFETRPYVKRKPERTLFGNIHLRFPQIATASSRVRALLRLAYYRDNAAP